MGQVLIRNLDDSLIADYRAAAKRAGTSLEAELREALARARPEAKPRTEELKALSSRLRAMTPREPLQDDSTIAIRRYRDTQGGRWSDEHSIDAAGS